MTSEERLTRLEQRYGFVIVLSCLVVLAFGGLSGYLAWQVHGLQTATSLRVKELRVYDDKGVDRVVIAGALPDPLFKGKPMKAPHREMAGMLIFDQTNTERGGYGTTNGYANAMLTLDAQGRQEFLLLAEPEGGPFFRAWNGKASVTLGAYDDPFITLMNGKDVVFAKPEDNMWTKRGVR